MTEVRITTQDFRAAGSKVCKDVFVLFFKPAGLDARRFVREGMTADELRQGCKDRAHLAMIDALEANARRRVAAGG